MTFAGVEHIGIAVKDLNDAIHVYRDILGFKLEGIHVLTDRKVKVAFFSAGGETRIELLEPLESDSTVAKFLENRGEGIHHVALRVDDIESVLAKLKDNGVMLVDEKLRVGAEDAKIAFIHPKSTKGVLLELIMKK